jgi:hypothetical protein
MKLFRLRSTPNFQGLDAITIAKNALQVIEAIATAIPQAQGMAPVTKALISLLDMLDVGFLAAVSTSF